MRKLLMVMLAGLSWLLLFTPVLHAQPSAAGVMEGSLGYPSEFIPEDMVICAENTATGQKHCTDRHLKGKKYTYSVGYRLTVPPGDYVVYAYLPNPARHGATWPSNHRAYYTEFVKCGMTENWPSHKKIVVRVQPGQTVTGIDPQDW